MRRQCGLTVTHVIVAGQGLSENTQWNFSDPPTSLFVFSGPSSGISSFRLRQDEVIDDLLAGRTPWS